MLAFALAFISLLPQIPTSQIPEIELRVTAGGLGSGLPPGDWKTAVPSGIQLNDEIYNQNLGNGYLVTGSVMEMEDGDITCIGITITPTGLGLGSQAYFYEVPESLSLPSDLYDLVMPTGQTISVWATS